VVVGNNRVFLYGKGRIVIAFSLLSMILLLSSFPIYQSAYAATTTISSDTILSNDFTNPVADTYIINPGVTLTIEAEFNNLGTVENHGIIIVNDGGALKNSGIIISTAGAFVYILEGEFENEPAGTLNNNEAAYLQHSLGSFVNNGTINNAGTIKNTEGHLINGIQGIINNNAHGQMRFVDADGMMNFGIMNNNELAVLENNVTISNFGTINNDCDAIITNFSGGVITGNPVVEIPCAEFPIVHMEDTTASYGLSTHSGRQIHAEFVSANSALVGDSIDSITLRLRKAGAPTGTAQIGVFNQDLSVKKLFGVQDAASLHPSTYADFTYSLANDELYTIQVGDRIGIKFTGGNGANSIAVMIDVNSADPFDGTNSYHQYYTTLWQSFTGEDMFMTLKQTHEGPDTTPPTVQASPSGGTYSEVQMVSLSANEPVTIYYTKDGSTPNSTAGFIYEGPISLAYPTVLKFVAVDEGENSSPVVTETYDIEVVDPPVPCNCVVFRYDDLQDFYYRPVQIAVLDKFITRNANLTVGPILNFVGNDQLIMNKVAEGVAEDNLFELALHGWNHTDYSTLSFEEQKATLEMANEKLTDIWGRPTEIFITPFNRYNADTLQAMQDLGMNIISADKDNESEVIPEEELYRAFSESNITDSYGIYHLPNTVGFWNHDEGAGVKTPVEDVIELANNRIETYGFAVIMLHPPEFAQVDENGVPDPSTPSQSELADLDTLITYYQTETGPQGVPYSIKTFSAIAGVPLPPIPPPPAFPIIHMSDTTQSHGLSTHAGRQIHAEFVSPTSELVGDQIDSTTLKLRKSGNPTGTAQIGIFNQDRTVKKLFGSIDVSTLHPQTYQDFTFLLSNDELYTIEAGDRIGIKFTGGSSSNNVAVMMDIDSADPFDGTNTYHQYYTNNWMSFPNEDLYMILKQTHAEGQPADTTPPSVSASPPGGLYSAAQDVTLIANEPATIYFTLDGSTPTVNSTVYASPLHIASSTVLKYIGKDNSGNISPVSHDDYVIDTIAPTVNASPLGGSYINSVSVSLSPSEPATVYYTTDGSNPTLASSIYANPIQITANTTLKYFAKDTAGNNGNIGEQIYDITVQQSFPVIHMSDTTESFGLSVHSGRQAQTEFVSATSQLVGDKIDSISIKLRRSGNPTGTAQIAVLNPDLSIKKLFGTIDSSTLTLAYVEHTFTLSNNELYTIEAGDRIGIKFTGGNSANNVAVMTDQNAGDPFDGVNTYHQHYTTSWQSFTANDLYMVLTQTHN
jgi:peptidoglycan/xylan/chitin deacetylase (PgdA/CDA1 family)